METKYKVNQIVYDKFLKREEIITDIVIHITESSTIIKYKLKTNAQYVDDSKIESCENKVVSKN